VNADDTLLELRQVSVWYGRQVVLRAVDLDIHAGESVAVLGPNGAGKTTILRVMATLLRPNRGQYVAFGEDAWERRTAVCARIGVLAHQPYVYPELTCRENLRYFGAMFRIADVDRRIDDLLGRVGLTERADRPAGSLSRGLLQRLNLARSLLHDPTVLLLDEPETGLDRDGRALLEVLVSELRAAGGAVVFATHAFDLAGVLATRVVNVDTGAVVAESTPARDESGSATVARKSQILTQSSRA
jgi:heme ABC exporter ATP-binding subunit CcmA